MTHHEGLGESLAALQLCGSGRRSDQHDAMQRRIAGKMIPDAPDERLFRPDHHHADLMCQAKPADLREIQHIQGHVLPLQRRPGIAGRNEQTITEGTLTDLPGQGMFPATGTKQ